MLTWAITEEAASSTLLSCSASHCWSPSAEKLRLPILISTFPCAFVTRHCFLLSILNALIQSVILLIAVHSFYQKNYEVIMLAVRGSYPLPSLCQPLSV